MVFSEFLNKIFGNNEVNNKKINVEAIDVLQQGMKHLLTKQTQINKNDIGNLMEGFKTPQVLQNASNRELKILRDMEGDYNQNLSEYSRRYKKFMENYYIARDNKINCMKKCMITHKGTSAQQIRLRESCIGGCSIKGPYIVQCENSYKGFYQNQNKKCKQMTAGKCDPSIQKIEPGYTTEMNSSSKRDSNNKTLADGCCDCGGGYGGKPKANVRGKKVNNCDDIYSAFGLLKGQSDSQPVINACKTATYIDEDKSSQMYLEYNALKETNEKLMIQAKKIYKKIKDIKGVRKGIRDILSSEEAYLKKQMNTFSSVYSDILNLDRSKGTGNETLSAQEEDAILKEKSSELKFYAWILLALLISSFTLKKVYEKN
jgi:hypothetical protein